jgi:hypothetical protein
MTRQGADMTDVRSGTALSHATLKAMAARWFPLVPRSKPVCRSLAERVTRACALAQAAITAEDDPLSRAAEALNLAALILSDCGAPEQAQDLCERQARLLAAARPHDVAAAKLSLQPLINIGRLLVRGGDPVACQYFQGLFDAVAARADVTIGGIEVNCSRLTRDDASHREIIRWLWPVMLSDGTRALTSAGRWAEALTHLQRHNGIGERMLDGRQVLVLSHCVAQDYEAAHAALPADTPTAWEHAVTRCLETLILTLAGDQPGTAAAQIADAYAQPGVTEQPVTFRTRLGLCARALATGTHYEPAIARQAIDAALDSADAYAAHDLVSDPGCLHHATPQETKTLTATVRAAGIAQGAPTGTAHTRLIHAVKASETAIARLLLTL